MNIGLNIGMAAAQVGTVKKPPTIATPPTPANPMAAIAESHIAGNVPAKADFDRFLKRDLAAYFAKATGKKVIVNYEFLREGPTQTGIAYPKYYLWVTVKNGGTVVEEGAVRVAAMDKKQFSVTHYLPKSAMTKNPEQIATVFPLAVTGKIQQRLKPQK